MSLPKMMGKHDILGLKLQRSKIDLLIELISSANSELLFSPSIRKTRKMFI